TDGDERATLAVTRALGRAGVHVTVGSSAPASLAGSSRFCASRVCYPSPKKHIEEFQAYLLDQMRNGGYQVLLPMTDITIQVVAQMGEALRSLVRVPIPTDTQLAQAQDKRQVLLLAARLGMAYPATYMLQGESLADAAPGM